MKKLLYFVILLFNSNLLFCQIAINTDGSLADTSAMLDIKSSTLGVLLPRMTHAEINSISGPSNGLLVYCTDCGISGLGALLMFMTGDWHMIITDCLNPHSPKEGIHVPNGPQITWKWESVVSATSYKWNSVNVYASATDVGMSTSHLQTGLSPDTTYTSYVWAVDTCGVSTPTTLTQYLPFMVGQNYAGGIIIYVDGTGEHGLIAATEDQSTAAEWGCYGTLVGASGVGIGTGQANTTAIVNGCSTSGIAARLCNDLDLNGYTDWFLPSKDELLKMYQQKSWISNIADETSSPPYWSSTESAEFQAWLQYFYTGQQNDKSKSLTYGVRAVRTF